MRGSEVWGNKCTHCRLEQAVIETWDYDEHAVLCLTCAARQAFFEAEYLRYQADKPEKHDAQRQQEVFDKFCLNILRVGTGA